MSKDCPACAGARFGTFTHGGVTHRDPACAWAANNGRAPEDVRVCDRCGSPGLHEGICERCIWWAGR